MRNIKFSTFLNKNFIGTKRYPFLATTVPTVERMTVTVILLQKQAFFAFSFISNVLIKSNSLVELLKILPIPRQNSQQAEIWHRGLQ